MLEDGIIEEQAGYGSGYVNNAVLCKMLSEVDGTPIGKLKEGEEVITYFDMTASEDKRIVVCLLKQDNYGNWFSNNVAQCRINEKTVYKYEQD